MVCTVRPVHPVGADTEAVFRTYCYCLISANTMTRFEVAKRVVCHGATQGARVLPSAACRAESLGPAHSGRKTAATPTYCSATICCVSYLATAAVVSAAISVL